MRDPVSVVATVYNEADTILDLIRSLQGQTRRPDEIVFVDGGSEDGTREVIEREAGSDARIRCLVAPGGRSFGRNTAVRAASHDILACIDGGCVAEPTWLEELTTPFTTGADWVAGFYRPEGPNLTSTCVGLVLVYVREEVREGDFLPSARSMAFRRSVWENVGGFPEHIEFAEDTLFDELLIDAGHRPVLALDAVVRWRPPDGFVQLWRTAYRWGRGDGETGLRAGTYRRLAALLGGTVVATCTVAVVWPPGAAATLAPLGGSLLRRTRWKYHWAHGTGKYVLIPAAALVHMTAALTGFMVGRGQRRAGGPA